MNEKKDDFLTSLQKNLEKELEYLKKEKQEEKEKEQLKLAEFRKNISEEVAKKCEKNKLESIQEVEKKIKKFYFWLFGIALVLLAIILGVFFILRGSSGS